MSRNRGPLGGPDMDENRSTRRPAQSGSDLASIGIEFALTIVVFVFGGVWLDKWLGTAPWFTIICVFVGAGGGTYSMYRRAVAATREHDAGRDTDRGGRGGGA